MDNFNNLENNERGANWLGIAVGGLVVFGLATVFVAINTMKPKEESFSYIEENAKEKEEFLEEGEDWFVEPEEISESMGEDFSFSEFWSEYLNFDEINLAEKTITDYFRFAFPKFSEIKVEKIVRDGKELTERAEEETEDTGEDFSEEFSEAFFEEEESEEEEEEDNNGNEEVLETTRIYLASDTGRKFYADIDAGKFGLIEVLIYTERGQEVFRYNGENDFDTFDYSESEIIEDAFEEISDEE